MTTLKSVAAQAGVSVATAARVLQGDPKLSVRPETRARVVEAAHDLGYRPNRVASGLRTRRTGTVAIVLPDPQNIMWNEMLRAIERTAGERDYVVVVADAHGPTLDAAQLGRFVLEGRMDGLLVAFATVADEFVAQIAGRGLPLVPVNSRSAIIDGSVTMDDGSGQPPRRRPPGGARARAHRVPGRSRRYRCGPPTRGRLPGRHGRPRPVGR